MKKILAVGIILLFFGVAVAPSINISVVKASDDNDLVEVTTQAYGIKGFGNTTVKLAREQYQNLEQYLVDFRARLNQTSIREEAVPLFKDAVVELDKYGLLPKGMSVEQAQKLVIRPDQDKKKFSFTERIQKDYLTNSINNNSHCLIAGFTSNTMILTTGTFLLCGLVVGVLGFAFLFYLLTFMPLIFLTRLLNLSGVVLNKIISFISLPALLLFGIVFLSYFFPTAFFSLITLGLTTYGSDNVHTHLPANGWVYSVNSHGNKKWEGSMYGQFREIAIVQEALYTGIIGFTGIKLVSPFHCFYLGSALAVNIGPSPP